MSKWEFICSLEEIPLRGARVVKGSTGDIALFRTAGDEVFALRDSCPHKGGPLSQGLVFGKIVSCPLHGWRTNLETGIVEEPDNGMVQTYGVKVEDGKVFLNIETSQ